jgi:hypothetical protein
MADGSAPPFIEIPAWVPPAERERQLDVLARAGAANPWVRTVAQRLDALLRHSLGRDPTGLERVQWLLDCLHDLAQYKPDPEGREVFQPVVYTLGCQCATAVSVLTGLRKGVGDCEDLGCAVASMGLVLGIPMRVKWWDQPGHVQNHVSAAIITGRDPIIVEATVPGARVGESPYEAVARVGPGFRSRVFGTVVPAGDAGMTGTLTVAGAPAGSRMEVDGAVQRGLAATLPSGIHVVRVVPPSGVPRFAPASVPVRAGVSVDFARMYLECPGTNHPDPL